MLWTVILVSAYVICGLCWLYAERKFLYRQGLVLGVPTAALVLVTGPLITIFWAPYYLIYAAGYLTAKAREVFRAGYRAGER